MRRRILKGTKRARLVNKYYYQVSGIKTTKMVHGGWMLTLKSTMQQMMKVKMKQKLKIILKVKRRVLAMHNCNE